MMRVAVAVAVAVAERMPPPVRIRAERRRVRGFLVCVQAYKKASQPFNLRIVKSSTAFELPAPVCVCVCDAHRRKNGSL